MVTLKIDEIETTVKEGTLIIEAARGAGIEIPHFCYHPRLSISGSCRMCLVEVEGAKKLVTACTTPVSQSMVIKTRSEIVKEAQRGMLAFLLVNHPLDCPVCDKGGECPLQDNTFKYGPAKSLFTDEKWHFGKPVDLSRLIVLDRERCILCTRCVRFQEEIAMHPELGIFERGRGSFIVAKEGGFTSNFSGNTIELCPVGALTSRPYRFKARPWELERTPSICPHCGCGCNIYLDVREDKVVRVLSRGNPSVDDGWLCDRGRFGYLFVNHPDRLKTPLIRKGEGLISCTWDEAIFTIIGSLKNVKDKYGGKSIAGLASARLTNEDLYILRKFIKDVAGSENIWSSLNGELETGLLNTTLFRDFRKFTFTDIDEADCIFLIEGDPGKDLPILDLRIKKAIKRGVRLYIVGPEDMELSEFSVSIIKSSEWVTDVGGKLIEEMKRLKKTVILFDEKITVEKVKFISSFLGETLTSRPLSDDNHSNRKTVNGWISIGVMQSGANSRGAVDIGIKSFKDKPDSPDSIKFLFVAQQELSDIAYLRHQLDFLVVYDLFMTNTAKAADVVLPAIAFSETDGTYTNTEGRVQRLFRAAGPDGEAKPLWEVFMMIANGMGTKWVYKSSSDVTAELKASGKMPDL